ncbi:MAG TPA: glucose 1-dehydrogenase [Acetobacteraceae bacterium]|nr:glucose 1-dehydrogenase [Acetobacteraceae bacterium]
MPQARPASPADRNSLFDLSGRVALVTGGNGGIGLGMALALARAGAAVVITGRNEAKNAAALDALRAAGSNAHALAADLADAEACRAMVAEAARGAGRLDILINNAGTNIRKSPQDYTLEEWNTVLATNLTSAFVACQAAHAPMRAAGAGKIINIGSMTSLFGTSFATAYGASKGGIVQMTRALASAWAPDHIQVNAVLPGWIDTDLTRAARREVGGLHERVLARTPAARWGTPEDMGGIAVFLASAASDFVTGTAIPVDGGYAAQG